jgi:hypothetical protein
MTGFMDSYVRMIDTIQKGCGYMCTSSERTLGPKGVYSFLWTAAVIQYSLVAKRLS